MILLVLTGICGELTGLALVMFAFISVGRASHIRFDICCTPTRFPADSRGTFVETVQPSFWAVIAKFSTLSPDAVSDEQRLASMSIHCTAISNEAGGRSLNSYLPRVSVRLFVDWWKSLSFLHDINGCPYIS